MAEIGVWRGDLSVQLLDALPELQLLLVDPYHLRPAGVAEDQPQGRAREALELAAQRLQVHRHRATQVVQSSREAAQWVERRGMEGWRGWGGFDGGYGCKML